MGYCCTRSREYDEPKAKYKQNLNYVPNFYEGTQDSHSPINFHQTQTEINQENLP